MKQFLRNIFSVENKNKSKCIKILGFKINIRNNSKVLIDKIHNEILNLKQYIDISFEHNSRIDLSVAKTHSEVFPQFKNINEGKDVVIVACGPTLNKYIPIKDAVHIGVNRAYQKDNIKLDYLFWIDARQNAKECFKELEKYDCVKFFGLHCNYECDPIIHKFPEQETPQIAQIYTEKNQAYRFYSNFPRDNIFLDIENNPLMDFGSITFPALHFALYTHPKRIYLVGCDCSNLGHYNSQEQLPWNLQKIKEGYQKFKIFAKIYYPDIEIISINPIGLKGLFIDEFYDQNFIEEKKETMLLINDTDNNYHFGCSATSTAIKNKIIEKDYKLTTITVDEIWKAKNPPKNFNDFMSEEYKLDYIKQNEDIIDKIIKADEIIVNGEGTILGFENRIGTQNLLFLIKIAQNYNKKVSIINHSCFPVFSPYEKNDVMSIYSTIYSKLYSCVVRDIRSLAIVKQLNCDNVQLGFDCLPLYIENYYKRPQNCKYEKQSYICLSGGCEFVNIFQEFLKNNVKILYKKYKKKIVFLMSNTTVKSLDDLKCIDIIQKFNSKSNIKIDVFYANNTNEFLSFIENSYFQITGRFHHSIAATYFNVPYVCFSSHSPKTQIFNDLINYSVIDVSSHTDEELYKKINIALENKFHVDNSKIIELCNNNFKYIGKDNQSKNGMVVERERESNPPT